jgi:hypothetical protein
MDATELWWTYADHLARIWGRAPQLLGGHGDHWFCVLTREQHTDVNQCILVPGARRDDAERVVSFIIDADVPAVVSVHSGSDETLTAPLAASEMKPAPLPEALMWCDTRPMTQNAGFVVTRAGNQEELELGIAVSAEGHAVEQGIAARVLTRDVSSTEDISTWITWDGNEPVSVVWLTHGERIGVWEMMTPPRHRRRGAARAALTTALAESWESSTEGAFLWATPAGRPLYDSLRFRPIDEFIVWVLGGDEAANLAVGQHG